jgi:hypothetical protein
MKKFILSAVLAIFATVATAGSWQSISMLGGGANAIYVTNTIGITNLFSSTGQGTNFFGTTFTNGTTRVTDTNGSSGSLLVDYIALPRWSDGKPMYSQTTNSLNYLQSQADVAITLVGGSGANSAISFLFTPVYGKGADTEGPTTQDWLVGVTATTTTPVTVVTNVPLHLWPGAAGFRCRRITNPDTDASAQVIVTEFSVNGYRP